MTIQIQNPAYRPDPKKIVNRGQLLVNWLVVEKP